MKNAHFAALQKGSVGADFWEVDLDSNFSIFGVNGLDLFTELPFL